MDDFEFGKMVVFLALLIGCGAIMIVECSNSADERVRWSSFKTAHACHIVGHTKETTHVGITTKGDLAIVGDKAKDTWLCDDGIMYTRERGE